MGIGRHSIEIPGTKSKTQESIGKLIYFGKNKTKTIKKTRINTAKV
jgi:hypothetical protein